ncbi:wax ester/triacylglycerol synthase domain-containing protein [Nonomuraea sp. NPDC050451]|uniref:wax ester/triacylglycerol synthase domain-containing protein n=1 Tax=Nonomuraea sp. NPDC050451 TaxID=3364364 RepID=UPI0037BB0738
MTLTAGAGVDDSYMHIGAATFLPGPPPAVADFQALLADMAARAPVLTYRLTGTGRHARWEVDPGFDPAHHVDLCEIPRGQDVHQAVVEIFRDRPLPRDRPLWNMLILHGHAEDEHVLCYRAHHVFQDGVALIGTILAFAHGSTVPPPAPGASPKVTPVGITFDVLRDAWKLMRRSHWRPPAGVRAQGRQIHLVRLDLAAYKEIGHDTGASRAQISVALVAGAVRALDPALWLRQSRRTPAEPVVELPINIRARGDGLLGNQLAMMPVTLPCAEASPLGRLRRVMDEMTPAKLSRRREANRQLYRTPVPLAHAFISLVSPLVRRLFRGRLVVSVPGRCDELPGSHGTFVIPPLLAGSVGSIVITQLGTVMLFAGMFDAAMPDADRLMNLIRHELAELRRQARQHNETRQPQEQAQHANEARNSNSSGEPPLG